MVVAVISGQSNTTSSNVDFNAAPSSLSNYFMPSPSRFAWTHIRGRAKREVEADAVAYVLGRYCRLDTSGSVLDLSGWASDHPEVDCDRLGRISYTAWAVVGGGGEN